MIICYENVLQVRRKAMETGCVNVFCSSLFKYATMCSPNLRLMKHFRSSQLPGSLVLPTLEFVRSFTHQQTLMHPQRGLEWGRDV